MSKEDRLTRREESRGTRQCTGENVAMIFTERPELTPPVTKASIMAAWQAAEAERREVELLCDVKIDPQGRIRQKGPR